MTSIQAKILSLEEYSPPFNTEEEDQEDSSRC
jgi:hypothetical protein